MATDIERRKVLEMIESGKLSAEEGLRLLEALIDYGDDDEIDSSESRRNTAPPNSTIFPIAIHPSKRIWQIPLWIGVTLVVLGAIAMFQALHSHGFGGWFILACLLLLTGVLLVFLAWESQSARWLRLYIRQKPGAWPGKISLSFPLPIRLTAWFLRAFRDKIPSLQNKSVDQLIQALEMKTSRENPIYIDVDGEENGERVQLFIG